MGNKKNATKRFLVIYCIAIFVFAVALILIASLSYTRANRVADEKIAAETLAADKQTRLDAVMTENTRLSAENKTLTEKNAELSEQKKNDDKRIAAYQKLAMIVNYHRLNDKVSLQNAITAFEEGSYTECLNVEDLNLYNSLK